MLDRTVCFDKGCHMVCTANKFSVNWIKFIGIEPKQSPLITKSYAKPHLIQGIGANFIPENYDASLVDEIITVSEQDAYIKRCASVC